MSDFDDLNSKLKKLEQADQDKLKAQKSKDAWIEFEATKVRNKLEPTLKNSISWYMSYCNDVTEPTMDLTGSHWRINFDGLVIEISGRDWGRDCLTWEIILHSELLPEGFPNGRRIARKTTDCIEKLQSVVKDMVVKIASLRTPD